MVLTFLTKLLGKTIQKACVQNSDLELRINSNNIYPVLCFLRKHTICQFNCLSDIICYDMPGKELRFGVVYTLLSTRFNHRIRISTKFSHNTGLLSVASLFNGAC